MPELVFGARASAGLTADELFQAHRRQIFHSTDRLFSGLLVLEWIGGIVAALFFTPNVSSGGQSVVHPHVWAAAILGAAITLPTAAMGIFKSGRPYTRYLISTCQALFSALLIHVTGGRIETHFHVFGSLAFLAFYRDWRLLIPATAIVGIDHAVRGLYFPHSVYGVEAASPWRWVEHVGWVAFEDFFLIIACIRSTREMRSIAERRTEYAALSNAELTAMRDTALDCMIVMDHHGRVVEFNPAAQRTFGYKLEEVVGKQLADLIVPPALRAAHRAGLQRYLAGGEASVLGKRIEVPAIRSDGSEFPVELSITALKVGEHPRFVAYLRDITELRNSREQAKHAEKLALVASRTDNAVIITDVGGMIEWVNEGFTRITGYTLDEVKGQKPGPLLQGPETDPKAVMHMRDCLKRGEGFSIEIVNYTKDKRPYWLAAEVQPICDAAGTVCNFIAIERDVTQRKHAETELLRAKEQAEQARSVAEAASRSKSQFLANMSHEIRTPLNGVIGMAELLMRKGGLSDQQLRYAEVIKSSGDTLLTLINDVLDFSKIEAGKLELHRVDFDLRSSVEDVIEMLAPRAAAKRLELACDIPSQIPARVHGDPDRLRQVLINLVNNAIKFTQQGEVIVRLERMQIESQGIKVRFMVRDTGVGIAADRRDRLFKSFSQVDASTTRKYGGTGLGLAIAKQLAELMGGQIGVESEVGKGSTFWFTALFTAAGHNAEEDHTSLTPAFQGLRVLAVDDQPTFQDILRNQMAVWGFDVETAGSSKEALRLLREAAATEAPFHVALVDMVMPGMDGAELAQVVNQDPALLKTTLIMLTSMDSPLDEAEMAAAGFAGCLTKPVRQSQLFDALADALAHRRKDLRGVRQERQRAKPQTNEPIQVQNRAARVLLAEDNLVNQEVAREVLVDAKCEVTAVGNGVEAVNAVRAASFDLVLMDCQMPELDGFEATAQIRELERQGALSKRPAGSGRIPIIALTANAVQGDRERCLAAGMDDYVSKPLDPRRLLAAMRKALGSSPDNNDPEPKPVKQSQVLPIDAGGLLARCMNKAPLAERLLTMFEQQVRTQVEQLQQLTNAKDSDSLRRLAHTLKGSSSNLSAQPLADASALLEALAQEQQWEQIDAAVAAVRQQVDQCLAYLPEAALALREAEVS